MNSVFTCRDGMILQRVGPKNQPRRMSPRRVNGMQNMDSRMLEKQRLRSSRLKGMRRSFSDSRITMIIRLLNRKPEAMRMLKTMMMIPSVN